MNKVVRVNMKNVSIIEEEIKEEYSYFGGRGLIANVMTDEVNPKCEPLGNENKLIIATGIFAGTTGPTVNRLSIGCKSPLTKTIKEANVGGTAGYMLARQGIKMIIIEEIPKLEGWYLLVFDHEMKSQLVPAEEYVGLNNYALVDKLHEKYGRKTAILSIGNAGEYGYRNSSIQGTDESGHPSRAAARGGVGAVMGSKKIKAIVVQEPETPKKIEYVDQAKFNEAVKKVIDAIKANGFTGYALPNFGTPFLTELINKNKILPINNFSGKSADVATLGEAIFVAKIVENEGKVGVRCQPGCPIKCSNIYNDSNKQYLTSGLEYETIAMCGSNCGIMSLDTVALMDKMCDDFGLDTIETGATIGVCMEADKLKFGDQEGAVNLIKEMMEKTEFGKILGQGTEATGNYLGVKRIPTVKGQALAAYDPRALKGIGVTFATSTMGADHTAGNPLGDPRVDPLSTEGQLKLSFELQVAMAFCDNAMCLFAISAIGSSPEAMEATGDMMQALYGGEWNFEKLLGIGVQTLILEKKFNNDAGMTKDSDKLPDFFYTEVSEQTGTVFDVPDGEMKNIFNTLL